MKHFKLAAESTQSSIERKLKMIFTDHWNKDKIISSLKTNIISLAQYELIDNQSYSKAKSDFFTGGLLYNYVNEVQNSKEEYWLTNYHLCFIIMSDNPDLYSMLKQNCNYPLSREHLWMTWINAILQIACGDWESVEKTYKFYLEEIKPIETIFFNTEVYKDIFSGFLESNSQKIENGLLKMESSSHKNPRKKSEPIEKYISPYTIALAKLAWMHGMEVEIDSPYVPKELLTFKPLDEYTIPYKFLRDYYRPLGYTWRYDPVHPELQDWDNDPENPDRNKGGFFNRLFSNL